MLASPPGFSQRATSFIASQCQGIHQMPFLRLSASPNSRNLPRQPTGWRVGQGRGLHRGRRFARNAANGYAPDPARSRVRSDSLLNSQKTLLVPNSREPCELQAERVPPRSHNSLLHDVSNSTARSSDRWQQCATATLGVVVPKAIRCFLPRSGASRLSAFTFANACRRDRSEVTDTPSRCDGVEVNGIEPMTSCLQSRRSPN